MAIKINFDSTYNAESPTFVLTTRNGSKIGVLPADNIKLNDPMNSYSELSFNVYKENCKNADGTINTDLWNQISDLKLLWCKEYGLYFELAVDKAESTDIVKRCSAVSLGDSELSQVYLHDIQVNTESDIAREDYIPTVLYDPEHPASSLLNRLLEKMPHYRIDHVDDGLGTIQRTFTFNDTTIYDALQDIAEELDCFVEVECVPMGKTIDRKISVYDLHSYCYHCGNRGDFTDTCDKCGSADVRGGYGEDTGILVNVENLAEEITLTSDKDSVKNCFRLEGGDDYMTATIKNCNPNGSNYMWAISEEMKDDMSPALAAKLDEYDALYNYFQTDDPETGYQLHLSPSLLNKYNALIRKYQPKNDKLREIPDPIVGYPALMNCYYDVVDFYLYLSSGMFPDTVIPDTTAETEAAKLAANFPAYIAVSNLETASKETVSNNALAMAKSIVDSRYRVKVASAEYANHTWTGTFEITRYADEEDTCVSSSITAGVNGDYETFIRQRIQNALHDESDEITDITELFDIENIDDDEFKDALKDYCLSRLNSFHDACRTVLDLLVEQGIADDETWGETMYADLYMPYYRRLGYIEDEIAVRESEIAIVNGVYDSENRLTDDGIRNIIERLRDYIQKQLDFETFLGTTLMLELSAYRREDTYKNDNYISDGLDNAQMFEKAAEFMEKAKEEIAIASTPQHSITATMHNLLVMREFAPLARQFKNGNWIRVRIDGEIYKLRLIEYEVDYDDLENLPVKFSDVKRWSDGMSDVMSILSQAKSMASSYTATKSDAVQGAAGNDRLMDWIKNGLSLTKMKIIESADNQNITWDSHGLLCREYMPEIRDYDGRQLKIINRGLYLTDDNWRTSKAGIGDFLIYNPETQQYEQKYAVAADVVQAPQVLTEKFGLYTDGNSVAINQDGIKVEGEKTIVTINPNDEDDYVFRISSKAQGESEYTDKIWMDANGNAHFDGMVTVGSGAGKRDVSITEVLNGTLGDVTTQYYESTSAQTATGGTWRDTIPSPRTANTYLWVRSKYSYADGTYEYGAAVCTEGVPGTPGGKGDDGYSRASLAVYKRSATTPTKPATANITYTFSTGVWSAVPSGWSKDIPDTDGNPCWVSTAVAVSNTDTATIAKTAWSNVVKLTSDGIQNATLNLYRRSSTQPADIDVDMTYTFATGALTDIPTGWSTSVPDGTTQCWVVSAVAISSGATDVIDADDWTTPAKLVADGAQGEKGDDGLNQATLFMYKRYETKPTDNPGAVTYTFSTGAVTSIQNYWSKTIPTSNTNFPCWIISAAAISANDTVTLDAGDWTAPVQLESLNQAVVTLYKRGASAPAAPTDALTYTFSSGALTPADSLAGWSQTIPGQDASGNPCWAISATAVSASNTDSIGTTEWSAAAKIIENGSDAVSYSIEPSDYAVIHDVNASSLTPSTLSFYAYKVIGSTTKQSYTAYKIVLQGYKGSTAEGAAVTKRNVSSASITLTTNMTSVKAQLYSDDTTVIDEQTVPIIKSGQNGTDGAPGTSVTVSEVKYASATSGTTPPSTESSWKTAIPSVAAGKYLWCRTKYSDGSTAYTSSYQGANGTSVVITSATKSGGVTTVVITDGTKTETLTINDGEDGPEGQKGDTGYVHVAWANSADGTTDFSTTVSANKKYIGVYSDNTKADSTTPGDYSWSLIKGADGADAYTVILTNESHTFPGGTAGATTGTTVSTSVLAFKGTTPVTPSNITVTIGGVTVTKTSNTVLQLNDDISNSTIVFKVNKAFTTSGVATVSMTIDNKTFTKDFTYSVAIKGTKGDPGESAYSAFLTNEMSAYVGDLNGVLIADTGTETTKMYVYHGTSTIPIYSVDSITVSDAKLSCVKASAVNSDGSWTFNIKGLAGLSGTSTATIVVRTGSNTGPTFTKVFSFNVTKTGATGATGVSVASVTNYYLATSASSNVKKTTSGWSTSIQTMTATKQYLWNYEEVIGDNGVTLSSTDPVIIGRYGQNGGTGVGISSITEYYQASSSNTDAPTTWSTTMVNTTTTNKYLWNYETITYTNGNTEDSTKRVIGTHGATGDAAVSYFIELSDSSAKVDAKKNVLPTNVTVYAYKRTGGGSRSSYSGRFKIYKDGGSTATYTSSGNETSHQFSIDPEASYYTIELYATDGTTSLLDRQTLPVLQDIANLEVGARNLALATGTAVTVKPTGSNNYCSPTNIFKTTEYGLAQLADTTKTQFTVSFDWAATGIDTEVSAYAALRYTENYTYRTVGAILPLTVGECSGHTEKTFTPIDGMREYGTGWMISGLGANNRDAEITISNFKFEVGNTATDWTPAPEDVTAEIQAAYTLAAGKSTVYYGTTNPPTTGSYNAGDVWIKKVTVSLDGGGTDTEQQMWTYTGSGWERHKAGTTSIVEGTITTDLLAANAVTTDKIATGSILIGDLANSTITGIADTVQIDSKNLIIHTLNPVVSPASNRPMLVGQTSNSTYGGNTIAIAEHGVRVSNTAAARTSFRMGSNSVTEGTLNGLEAGETYSWSFDASWKVLSGTISDTNTYYVRAYLYSKTAAADSYTVTSLQTLGTITNAKRGTEMTGRCEFTFTVPEDAVMCFLQFSCSYGTAAGYAAGDYIELRNLKLEKGNRVTGWTPAPEDVAAGIDAADQAAATANTLAAGKSTVYYSTANPSAGSYNTGDVWIKQGTGEQEMWTYTGSKWEKHIAGTTSIKDGAITTDLLAANAVTTNKIATGAILIGNLASSTVTGITDTVQIGGRNFVLKSDEQISVTVGTSSSVTTKPLSDFGKTELGTVGTKCTISFDAKSDVAGTQVGGRYIRNSSSTPVTDATDKNHLIDLTTDWVRYSGTCNITATGAAIIGFYVPAGTAGSKVFIKNIKVETGTKATDWTPAPEDVAADITGVQTNLDNLQVGGRNLFIASTRLADRYVNNSGGVATWYRGALSDYIPVVEGDKLILQFWKPENTSATGDNRGWYCISTYNASKTFIARPNNAYFTSDYLTTLYTVPSGVSFVRVSYHFGIDGPYGLNWDPCGDFKVKVERGDKATDWSLAPEDAANIDVALRGQNMLLNTAAERTIKNSLTDYTFTDLGTEVVTANKIVTVSMDVKTTEPGHKMDIYFRYDKDGTETNTATGLGVLSDLTADYKRYVASIQMPDVAYPYVKMRVRSNSSVTDGSETATVSVKNVKLELGGSDTAYSKAPEDIDSTATEAKALAAAAGEMASAANTLAAGKSTVHYSSSNPPSSGTYQAGDVWIKQGTGQQEMWTYTGSAWSKHIAGTTSIMEGAITTDLLATNAVTAEKIKAGSIYANKILISDYTNLATITEKIPDYTIALQYYGGAVVQDGYITKSSAAYNSMMVREWGNNDCHAGEEFYYEFTAHTDTAGTAYIRWAGASVLSPTASSQVYGVVSKTFTATTSDQRFTGTIKLPETVGSAAIEDIVAYCFYFYSEAATRGKIYVKDLTIKRKSGGNLIVDGSITADKLSVNSLETMSATLTTDSGGKMFTLGDGQIKGYLPNTSGGTVETFSLSATGEMKITEINVTSSIGFNSGSSQQATTLELNGTVWGTDASHKSQGTWLNIYNGTLWLDANSKINCNGSAVCGDITVKYGKSVYGTKSDGTTFEIMNPTNAGGVQFKTASFFVKSGATFEGDVLCDSIYMPNNKHLYSYTYDPNYSGTAASLMYVNNQNEIVIGDSNLTVWVSPKATFNGGITLPNNVAILGKTTSGSEVNLIKLGSSIILGATGKDLVVHSDVLFGYNVEFNSTLTIYHDYVTIVDENLNDVPFDDYISTLKVSHITDHIYLDNTKRIYGYKSDGTTALSMMYLSSGGNLIIGASSGMSTYLYGAKIYARKLIQVGSVSVTTSGSTVYKTGSVEVTFPTSFGATPKVVTTIATAVASDDIVTTAVTDTSTTKFTVHVASMKAGTYTVNWMAAYTL